MGPLVGNDGLHGGRFTDDAAGGPDAVFLQVPDQAAYTQAADFFVVTQRIMQRRVKTLGIQSSHEFRGLGEDDADETLHVGGTAGIQLAVRLRDRKGVGGPVLAVHGHDVGMSRQDQAGFGRIAQGGKEIRFLSGGVVREPRLGALPVEIIANPFDQVHVRVARDGLEGDETLDHGTCGRARSRGRRSGL
jgi:hypothetical protein